MLWHYRRVAWICYLPRIALFFADSVIFAKLRHWRDVTLAEHVVFLSVGKSPHNWQTPPTQVSRLSVLYFRRMKTPVMRLKCLGRLVMPNFLCCIVLTRRDTSMTFLHRHHFMSAHKSMSITIDMLLTHFLHWQRMTCQAQQNVAVYQVSMPKLTIMSRHATCSAKLIPGW
jgi:hypothetical protein